MISRKLIRRRKRRRVAPSIRARVYHVTAANPVAEARRIIQTVEADIAGRFYGLENVTARGLRIWSLATVAPAQARAAITGAAPPAPDHIAVRWCIGRRAWRSVDLRTVRRIWYRDRTGVRREYVFKAPDALPATKI